MSQSATESDVLAIRESADLDVTLVGDRVLVLPAAPETITAGGIAIPDNAQEKSQRGRVVQTGNGIMLESGGRAKMTVCVGDEILFDRYAGVLVEIDDVEYRVMQEKDVLVVLR